eukprot:239416-Pelagomonas_calceolata.AAC.2
MNHNAHVLMRKLPKTPCYDQLCPAAFQVCSTPHPSVQHLIQVCSASSRCAAPHPSVQHLIQVCSTPHPASWPWCCWRSWCASTELQVEICGRQEVAEISLLHLVMALWKEYQCSIQGAAMGIVAET